MEEVSACPARLLERGAGARRVGGGTSQSRQVPSRAVAALLFCLLAARVSGATRTARGAGGGEQATVGSGGRGRGVRAHTLLQTCPAPGDALVATGDVFLDIQDPLVAVFQDTAGMVRAERHSLISDLRLTYGADSPPAHEGALPPAGGRIHAHGLLGRGRHHGEL